MCCEHLQAPFCGDECSPPTPHPLVCMQIAGLVKLTKGPALPNGGMGLHCVCLQTARVFHRWHRLLSDGFVFISSAPFQANTTTHLIDGEPSSQRMTAATPLFVPF